jgi:hypothetical protein
MHGSRERAPELEGKSRRRGQSDTLYILAPPCTSTCYQLNVYSTLLNSAARYRCVLFVSINCSSPAVLNINACTYHPCYRKHSGESHASSSW